MSEPIISRASIEAKARAAAKTYNNIFDACPYPFATEAAKVFCTEFTREREAMAAKLNGTTTATKKADPQ